MKLVSCLRRHPATPPLLLRGRISRNRISTALYSLPASPVCGMMLLIVLLLTHPSIAGTISASRKTPSRRQSSLKVTFRFYSQSDGSPVRLWLQKLVLSGTTRTLAAKTGQQVLPPPTEYSSSFYFSPSDRSLIAAASLAEDPQNINTLNDLYYLLLIGPNKHWKRLTKDDAGYHNIQWSSDEKYIAYVSYAGVDRPYPPTEDWKVPFTVYVQNVQTGERWKLFQEDAAGKTGGDSWYRIINRDGLYWIRNRLQLLYISDAPDGLFLLSKEHIATCLLQPAPAGLSVQARKIWFNDTDRLDKEAKFSVLRILELPTESAELTQLTTWKHLKPVGSFRLPGGYSAPLFFSPDGKRVALTVTPFGLPEGSPPVLTVLELATGKAHLLGTVARGFRSLDWSRDGRYLLWKEYPETPQSPKIVALPVDEVPDLLIAQADWKHQVPVKPILLLEFPPNVGVDIQ